MAQVTAMPSAPVAAADRTPRTTPRRAAPAPQEEAMSVVAYLLQGSAFIGFLLVLFVLAGFRG